MSESIFEHIDGSYPHPSSSRIAVLVLLAAVLVLSIGALVVSADGPPLTVDSPPEGLLTRDWFLPVTGTTSPDTLVTVHLENHWHENRNETTSLADGSYEVWINLDWGRNLINVTAGEEETGITTVTRNVTQDSWAPNLEVRMEFLNSVPIPYDDVRGAYVVSDTEVMVNGTCHDYNTNNEDLLVRINSEPVVPGPDQRGRFLARVELEPGLNAISVDVADVLGNRGTVTHQVLRDIEPPPVMVYRPVDNEVTQDASYLVEGITEPMTYVTVRVQSPDGYRSFSATSRGAGTFHVPVELVEGSQLISVTVLDAMGNMNSTVLSITLDTNPPDLVIVSPPEGYATTREIRYTIVAMLVDDQDAVVTVGGQEVEGTGLFQLEMDLREGANVFKVKAVDGAGNERAVLVTIVRDTFCPIMIMHSPQYAELLTNDPTVPFAGTVKGAVGVTIKHRGVTDQAWLTRGSWEDGEWAYDLELTEDDLECNVEVYAHDAANNRDTVTFHVVLDMTPPPLAIDGGPIQITNRRSARITGVTEEGLVSLTIDDDRVDVDDGVFDVSVSLEVGVNTFLVRIRDRAGNWACETLEITYDPVPPELELDYPRSTRNGTVSVIGTTDDDVVWVYVDGLSFFVDNGSFAFFIDLAGEGMHEINFTVEDAAGNRRTELVEIDYGTETPGLGPILVLLAIAVAALVVRQGRRTQ